MKDTYKAIALFSGGLDSLLSFFYMRKLGVEVIPIFFRTPFFTEEKARRYSKQNNFEIEVIDISKRYMDILINPTYGFGKNLNPCIDCHGIMFNIAGNLLSEYNADFLVSGEVLGQRPMSQRKDTLDAVRKLSGYKDLIVRPLSQKLLPDTKPIRENWVDKNSLLDISGRGRERQRNLSHELGIVSYPNSAGGCKLTDNNFCCRLKDLIKFNQMSITNIELLNYGRHFRIDESSKVIIGRDENENYNLQIYGKLYINLVCNDYPGPVGILCTETVTDDKIKQAARILSFYIKNARKAIRVSYGYDNSLTQSIYIEQENIEYINKTMIKASYD